MQDRREELLYKQHGKLFDDRGLPIDGSTNMVLVYKPAAITAMDEYMKITCLELLKYIEDNNVLLGMNKDKWFFKGEWITKEELFKNFL